MKSSGEIIISEGIRPFWHIIIAALFFTVTLALLGLMCFNLYYDHSEGGFRSCIHTIELALLSFIPGIRYSIITNLCLDITNKRYKTQYTVGPVKIGKWQPLPNVEYISVFKQGWSKDGDGDGIADAAGYNYNVNVWHSTSKHFTIYESDQKELSFEMAKNLAIKLEVDLLDATIPNDFKWVELRPLPQHIP